MSMPARKAALAGVVRSFLRPVDLVAVDVDGHAHAPLQQGRSRQKPTTAPTTRPMTNQCGAGQPHDEKANPSPPQPLRFVAGSPTPMPTSPISSTGLDAGRSDLVADAESAGRCVDELARKENEVIIGLLRLRANGASASPAGKEADSARASI